MKKETILTHTLVSILLSAGLYFYQPLFAKSFLVSSFVFNLYLRMLYKGFDLPIPGKDENGKINPLTVFSSIFRVMLTAGIIAILIIKFKLNLIAAALAFLLYQLVLVAIGFYYNASHHGRNTRQDG